MGGTQEASMLFAIIPGMKLGVGPEFYNNMDSPNNAFGAEDSKAWMYNNMDAPSNARGLEDDKAAMYNNMQSVGNCVGGSEQGCNPFAAAPRMVGLVSFQ